MVITSLDNSKVKLIAKLNQAKYRKKEGLFVVEGAHLVDEARKAGVLVEAFSLEEKEGYTTLTKQIMDKVCNTSTTVTELAICRLFEQKKLTDRVLILDGVQDPGNLGTLMRSANAFNFKTIVLGNGTVDIYNDKVIRSSQGAIFKLNFINANLTEFIPTLKDYMVYGTNVVNGVELDDAKEFDKLAVVLGNEGNGISQEVFNLIEKNIYIPMNNTESLNVGVAGSIIMYKFRR